MKKRYFAAILIPLVLAFILAYLMTPSSEALFMKKMKLYFETEDFYVEKEYRASGDIFKVKQSKVKDNYYLNISDKSGEEILLNMEGDKVFYGFSDMAVSVSKADFEEDKSIVLLDKISVRDVDKNSISLDKEKHGLYYNFSMKDGRKYAVLFDKGVLSQLTCYGVEFLPHVSSKAVETISADVAIKYSNWQSPSDLSGVVKLSNTAEVYSLDELSRTGNETTKLKRVAGLLDEYDDDDQDDFEEDDYEDEEEDNGFEIHYDSTDTKPDFEVLDF